jgi:hypothetical protein
MRSDTLNSSMFSLANRLMDRVLPKFVFAEQKNLNRMKISFQQIELMGMDAHSSRKKGAASSGERRARQAAPVQVQSDDGYQ